MFGGLGAIFIALLFLPIVGGIAAGLFFLSVPRLRFLAVYSALVPLLGVAGAIAGRIGGMRLAQPYFYQYEYAISRIVWPAWVITIAVMLLGIAVGIV